MPKNHEYFRQEIRLQMQDSRKLCAGQAHKEPHAHIYIHILGSYVYPSEINIGFIFHLVELHECTLTVNSTNNPSDRLDRDIMI